MRSKALVYGIWILGIVLLQSMVGAISIFGIKPNVLVIFVALVGLLRNNTEASTVGAICGLLLDLTTGKTMGFYTLLGLFLGAATGSLNRKLYRDNGFVGMLVVFASTIFYEFAVYIFGVYVSHQGDIWYAITRIILPEAIYNSFLAIFMFGLILRTSYIFEDSDNRNHKY